jgi:phosphonate transport system substrate-binding protein
MKSIKSFFLFLFLFFLGSCSQKTDPNVVRLGIQPNEKDADLATFAKELEGASGLKVEYVVSHDYNDLVTQFKNGKVDFAFFSPVNFIAAEKDAGAKVLLKKVYGASEFYFSALVVKADSHVKSVTDLKGQTLAFVDPKSTSGYLYPLVMLKKSNLTLKDLSYEFAGTHDKAIEALLSGKAAAAAVWGDEPSKGTGAWTPFEKDGVKFRVLAWSEPIPNDAFAVRSKFYQENPNVVFKVMEGLISMSDADVGALKKVFDTDRMTTATSRHYDSVRSILEAQGLQQ